MTIQGYFIWITISFSVEVEAKVKVRTRVQLVDVNLKVSFTNLLASYWSSSGPQTPWDEDGPRIPNRKVINDLGWLHLYRYNESNQAEKKILLI